MSGRREWRGAAVLGAGAIAVWPATTVRWARTVAVATATALSAAVGLSRLYLGDHWSTDVLASFALVGLTLGLVTELVSHRLPFRTT